MIWGGGGPDGVPRPVRLQRRPAGLPAGRSRSRRRNRRRSGLYARGRRPGGVRRPEHRRRTLEPATSGKNWIFPAGSSASAAPRSTLMTAVTERDPLVVFCPRRAAGRGRRRHRTPPPARPSGPPSAKNDVGRGPRPSRPRRPRRRTTGPARSRSSAIPRRLVATIRGEPHLLCLVRQGLVSPGPAPRGRSGSVTGSAAASARASTPPARSSSGTESLLSAAYDVGSALLEVNAAGDGVREVWRKPRPVGLSLEHAGRP